MWTLLHSSYRRVFEARPYIGIERVNQVLRFDFGHDGVRAHGKPAVRLLTGESSNGTVQTGIYRKPYLNRTP
jgi:hypothetical protein